MTVDKEMPILVVDDFMTIIRITENQLRQLGFTHIDNAADVQTALEKMREKQYRLIISDWDMEPVDGLQLLKTIRTTHSKEELPVILITAESTVENIRAAKQAGMNNYIIKPFNVSTLKEKLSTVFGAF